MVMFTYGACRNFFSGISISSLNPTVAFSIWIFNLSVYDNLKASAGGDTEFSTLKLGKYVWVYMLAGGFAAPLAGFIAKSLIVTMKDNDDLSQELADQRSTELKLANEDN